MKCRHCQSQLQHRFLDLGYAPPSNAYLTPDMLFAAEATFPLRLRVCDQCWLVQTEDFTDTSLLFSHQYAYFSSTSKTFLQHAKNYTQTIIEKANLNEKSFVVEIASNDGYLLKNFIERHIPCLGIEPTASTAKAAEALGIPVLQTFFNSDVATLLANQGKQADLICANNVYAHVPDINDFTKGLKILLKKNGVITLEFPHLLQLLDNNQFDTIYHEHFSYLSLDIVSRIFKNEGLFVYDVEELSTHGGSLRVYGGHAQSQQTTSMAVKQLLQKEKECGLQDLDIYFAFQKRANKIKNDFLQFLIEQHRAGKSVAAYGAAAKGNTLLNFSGIKSDLISFVCDAAPSKQNKYLPGSHIPILSPAVLPERRPDWLIIFPWNIADEIREHIKCDWPMKFVVAIPELRILS